MSGDLFGAPAIPGLVHLPGFALADENALIAAGLEVADASPFRVMATPGGAKMSAAITNCGAAGWVSDKRGYRYERHDPRTGRPWPEMPAIFRELAERAAAQAGFAGFTPDVCLMNRYEPGAKMGLHQDRDEADFSAPSSLSLWACRRYSSGAGQNVRTGAQNCRCTAAMWWCGAAPSGSIFMASARSNPAATRCWGKSG